MGSECESEKTTPPKLSLYSLPSKAKEPSGMTTPPIQTSVSIPFQWEEVPGKPRPCATANQSNPHRCLELPPRLLAEAKTLSFRKSESFRIPDGSRVNKVKVVFGSSRWGSFRKPGRVVQGSFDFSSPMVADGGTVGSAQMKITRDRRKGSLSLSLSQATSHVLASIYESFKQVVTWRRK
ncbi:putative RWP-RK domain-containing protein [Hibiscus syriacus]|uniref:RWP-RK domain-containing protein n=1 Tax=Hibiscus syriacus TaxID=106335 RepID=A0A6A3B8Y5_HIBSY|nr:putative RWP-RK domain-containing protein [Hibiscus syriacus]